MLPYTRLHLRCVMMQALVFGLAWEGETFDRFPVTVTPMLRGMAQRWERQPRPWQLERPLQEASDYHYHYIIDTITSSIMFIITQCGYDMNLAQYPILIQMSHHASSHVQELPLDMAPFDPIRFDRSHLPAFIKGLPSKLTVAWCIFRLA